MSEHPTQEPSDEERYAYAVTRRLFNWTAIGTVLFAATILVIWKFFS